MHRLSTPLAQIQKHYDVVVIGSGYGGGIASSRLARSGKKVCLLERGKEFLPGEFPNDQGEALESFQVKTPEKDVGSPTGLFEFHVNKDINVVTGCGLGGTSLINANVALKADDRVFGNGKWPAELLSDLGTASRRASSKQKRC